MEHEKLTALAATFTAKELPESELELTGEIPFEFIAPLESRALEHFRQELELPGFRKGHVPADVARKKVGDIAILEEAVELFMADFYPALITERSIEAIGRPQIRITKLAAGNPVGISIRTAVYPAIELPKEWRDIGKDVPLDPVAPTEEREIDEALESIRRAQAKAGDPNATPGSEVAPEVLPPLDDAFAKSLGAFADLADLKAKMRENLQMEKERKARDARRGKIIEILLTETPLSVPAIFVDSELEKILAQMQEDISRYGVSFEDYLKHVGKSVEDLRAELTEQARSRAKLQLILNKIAEEEKVEADKDAVEVEMAHALEHFPDAKPELVRIHIETVLRNEKVLQLLEGTVEAPAPDKK